MPPADTILRWQSSDGSGLEHCVVRRDGDLFLADGYAIAPRDGNFAVHYRIRFDGEWRVRAVEARISEAGAPILLGSDGEGRWSVNGTPATFLDGAIAPDLSITPLTNTFAIERLKLEDGQSRDIVTAYISFPDGKVLADPQRYTCLQKGRLYRYESLDSDFARVITIAGDGFVEDYPGLFRRIPA